MTGIARLKLKSLGQMLASIAVCWPSVCLATDAGSEAWFRLRSLEQVQSSLGLSQHDFGG